MWRSGSGVRIQSYTFICELVAIEDDCFVSRGAVFINDRFEDGGLAEGGPSKWEHTVIEDTARVHFAEYNEKRVRTYGTAGTLSYYPGKISVLAATPELS